VRKELEIQQEREERRALEEKLVDLLLARHEFQVPEAMVLRQVARMIEHARDRVRRQGMDPDQIRWDYGRLAEELRPAALRAVRRALFLAAVAGQEGIAATEEEVNARVEEIAKASQRPVAAIRGLLEKNSGLDALRDSIRETRVVDFLIQRNRVESEVH